MFKFHILDLLPVLSNGGNGGAMAVLRGENLKKLHRIAVAWRFYNDGAMAVMVV